ncbi:hypothetical protein SS05631_b58780 (plasmid) [Sinorhizobium sp. CCBAU 05631]|nr:hypothetical protein SS05631_b58780 [Sinorhizobium sp. CCBAU 05631]
MFQADLRHSNAFLETPCPKPGNALRKRGVGCQPPCGARSGTGAGTYPYFCGRPIDER